jgi:hypothetical protein
MKRSPISPETREKLRQAALKNRPWRHSTGPRTAAGKAQARLNGKKRQSGPVSVRELRSEIQDVGHLLAKLAECRRLLLP